MPDSEEPLELVDRLVAEYADRLARDEDPRREELLAQAPGVRAALERLFALLEDNTETRSTLAPGLELGDFRILRALGRGGMAVVYEAEQKSLHRRVALKVLRAHLTLDEKHFERFQREARAAAKLRHEHIVPIHLVGTDRGHAFIAFELIEGPTLARVIEGLAELGGRPGAADLARASGWAALAEETSYAAACVRLLSGVFEALECAHGQGVIHRDLKPSNLLLSGSGKALVADFGLAKDMGEASLSLTGETLGTPHYLAPEQAGALERRVDVRTDVYALGVTLYELLTLRRPFEGGTLAELVQKITTLAPPPLTELAPDVPSGIADVVLQALAKDPAQRYPGVAAFRADLERAVRGEAVEARATRGVEALFGSWFEARFQGRPFEYRSRRTVFGWPWIHVALGIHDPRTRRPKTAKGVIAVGNTAIGLYASGQVAVGLLAFGLIAVGPVALGAVALGFSVTGGMAFGWRALGIFAAGHSGRGVSGEWFARPELGESTGRDLGALSQGPLLGLLVTLVGILLSVTMIQGMWTRMFPGAAQRKWILRVTRFWLPVLYLIPWGLELAGLRLPVPAHVLILGAITLVVALYLRLQLRALGSG